MSDEEEQLEYFRYVDDLVKEMQELFVQHEELVGEYSRAMDYIGQRNWRQGYVHWVADRDSVEGEIDG